MLSGFKNTLANWLKRSGSQKSEISSDPRVREVVDRLQRELQSQLNSSNADPLDPTRYRVKHPGQSLGEPHGDHSGQFIVPGLRETERLDDLRDYLCNHVVDRAYPEIEDKLPEIQTRVSDDLAMALIREERWGEGVACVHCHSTKTRRVGVHPQNPYCYVYECSACGGRFDDLSGTGLSAYSRTIRQWIHCWLFVGFGLTPAMVAKALGIPEASAVRMIEVLRTALPEFDFEIRYHSKGENKPDNDEEALRMKKRKQQYSFARKPFPGR